MSLNDVLVWVVTGGGSIIAASWIAERWSWFQAQSSKAKEGMFFGLSVAFAVGAKAVMLYVPADVLALIAPWAELVLAIFMVQFIGKGYHLVDKSK